jgi:hypothetical protein
VKKESKLPTSRPLAIVYLLHLAVPAFLFADVVAALLRHRISLPSPSTAVAAVSAVWICAGLGLFLRSRDRNAFLRKANAPLTSIYSAYVAVLLLEGTVRLMGLTPPIPGARQPWTHAVTTMDPKVYPGVSGPKRFTTNTLGLRGPMPPGGGGSYKILAVGGSTTICANLDDSEEWPHRVMEQMNSVEKARPVWVGNAGVAATNTIHHLILMQWLPGVLHVDMAIFLTGVNDLTATLAFDGGPTQAFLEKEAGFQGDLPPGTHWRSQRIYPLYRRLRLFLVIQEAGVKLKQLFRPPASLPLIDIEPFRQRRMAAPVVPLPDLSTGLKEYRSRIVSLEDRCKDLKLRCLFLTQPYMWRDNLSARENHLLWQGYLGRFEHPKGYISAGNMAQAMDSYNQTLLDVCRQDGLECYDMAAHIPKDTSAFFDEMHFNESGARMVAQNLTEYLLSTAPFGTQRR